MSVVDEVYLACFFAVGDGVRLNTIVEWMMGRPGGLRDRGVL